MGEADDELRLRVANLETTVAALRDDIAQLTARSPSLEPAQAVRVRAPVTPPTPAAPRRLVQQAASEMPRNPYVSDDASRIEHLVGRYGVLALATLLTLFAVSTFVRWAAMHGMLGPTARVVLGLLLAAALAAGGLRLRRREPWFGSSLLILALAVVEVCAWSAGPALHLVPDSMALTLSTLASAALAAFARLENDEPLWCIGIAGAAVAPFVTSSQSGSAFVLAAYGAGVGLAAATGIANTRWRHAQSTLAGIVVLYAAVLQLPAPQPRWGPLLAVALPWVVLVAGILPFTDEQLIRPRLRAQGLIASVAALLAVRLVAPWGVAWTVAAFGSATVLWLVIADRTGQIAASVPDAPDRVPSAPPADVEPTVPAWIDGAVIPLLFIAAAAGVRSGAPWWRVEVSAAGAVALLAALWRRAPGASRDALALAVVICAFVAIAVAPWRVPVLYPVAYASLGVVCVLLCLGRPSYAWLVGATAVIGAAGANTWMLMFARTAFRYPPFGTRESLAALAVLAACAVAAAQRDRLAAAFRAGSTKGAPGVLDNPNVRARIRAVPWVWAFVWAHRELAGAWNPALATLALVTLEAAVAVALVAIGRARDLAVLRRTGLLLALVAAFRALAAVEGIASVSLRIASYMVASVFLLGIAYGYRRRGRGEIPVDGRAEL